MFNRLILKELETWAVKSNKSVTGFEPGRFHIKYLRFFCVPSFSVLEIPEWRRFGKYVFKTYKLTRIKLIHLIFEYKQ